MKFSRRTAWDRHLNAISSRIDELTSGGSHLIDLTESNPTRCGFAYPESEIARALGSQPVLVYEPDPRGLLASRRSLAEHLSKRGSPVGPDQLFLCSGTSEAYAFLFKLLCDAGDNVLVPNPSYPLFDFLTELESVQPRPYGLRLGSRWELEIDRLAGVGDDRTRAVLVVNPGNPIGAFLRRAELEALQELCADRSWALIVDEVFSDYSLVHQPELVPSVLSRESAALTFSLGGLSKKAGLPQLKTSWLAVAGPDQARDDALARLEVIADTYLFSSPLLQGALPQLLNVCETIQRQIRERVIDNQAALMAQRSPGASWTALPVEGGWYAVIRLSPSADEEALCLELLNRGVIVYPGYFFDFPEGKFLVLSLIVQSSAFSKGLEVLRLVLS
jgi:aspartate/methionine/tyrosine aminotransferase